MHAIEIGKPYIPGKTDYAEGGEYNYRSGTHELRIFLHDLAVAEISAVESGEAEFAFAYEQPDMLMFLYRFGRVLTWSDAPYTIHLVPEAQRTEPPSLSDDERALLTIILIDAHSGIVKALRVVSLSSELSAKLHAHIQRQAAAPFDEGAYDAALAALQARFTSSALARRAVASCRIPGASN